MRHKMFTNHYSPAEMRPKHRLLGGGAISAQGFCRTILLKAGMTLEAAAKSSANEFLPSQGKLLNQAKIISQLAEK